MKYYAGLDVSVKETSLCIVDEAGKICREVKVSEPSGGSGSSAHPPGNCFESGLKPDLCRNGCSVVWRRQDCR
jgi:hypothetical protein